MMNKVIVGCERIKKKKSYLCVENPNNDCFLVLTLPPPSCQFPSCPPLLFPIPHSVFPPFPSPQSYYFPFLLCFCSSPFFLLFFHASQFLLLSSYPSTFLLSVFLPFPIPLTVFLFFLVPPPFFPPLPHSSIVPPVFLFFSYFTSFLSTLLSSSSYLGHAPILPTLPHSSFSVSLSPSILSLSLLTHSVSLIIFFFPPSPFLPFFYLFLSSPSLPSLLPSIIPYFSSSYSSLSIHLLSVPSLFLLPSLHVLPTSILPSSPYLDNQNFTSILFPLTLT